MCDPIFVLENPDTPAGLAQQVPACIQSWISFLQWVDSDTSGIEEGRNVLLNVLHNRIRPLLDLKALGKAERLEPGDDRLRDPHDLLQFMFIHISQQTSPHFSFYDSFAPEPALGSTSTR